jgi:hypothetical protein
MSSIMTCIVRIMFNYRKVNVGHVCAFQLHVKRLWINELGDRTTLECQILIT